MGYGAFKVHRQLNIVTSSGHVSSQDDVAFLLPNCEVGRRENDRMLPLHQDPWFTFRFGDDRIIPRFHLEGVPPGSQISVVKINPETGERLGLLATATVGDGGWVDLPQPIIVRAGEAFV